MATMYIERRREKRKLKPDSFYYYLTVQEKTRKKRKYIPLGKVSGLMDMLESGLRHMPVLTSQGRVLGVVEETDLVASSTRRSFLLRRAIGV